MSWACGTYGRDEKFEQAQAEKLEVKSKLKDMAINDRKI
jgi:hypothetical protein